jgi:HEPN domain-containing protein
MDKEKRTLILFWLKKAQNDLLIVQELSSKFPDAAIYHCQQSAEKSLKAFLTLHDREALKTHNIGDLIVEASRIKPELRDRLREAAALTQYNQTYRYPINPTEDFNPTPGELRKAFHLAKAVYDKICELMPAEIVIKPPQPDIES